MGAGSAAAKLRPRAAFRALNEQIKQLETGWASDQLHLVCECDDDRCFRPLTITPSDYERVRRDSKQFLVLPGHEPSQVAEVVEAAGGYVVVRRNNATVAAAELAVADGEYEASGASAAD